MIMRLMMVHDRADLSPPRPRLVLDAVPAGRGTCARCLYSVCKRVRGVGCQSKGRRHHHTKKKKQKERERGGDMRKTQHFFHACFTPTTTPQTP
jgi:hypothetical protein